MSKNELNVNGVSKDVLFSNDNKDGVFATSRGIAEVFGKRHDNVMRSIESIGRFGVLINDLKIEVSEYLIDGATKPYKQYLLDRDVFSFVVMGFTGKHAEEWKWAYIDAFNQIEKMIRDKEHLIDEETSLQDLMKMKSLVDQLIINKATEGESLKKELKNEKELRLKDAELHKLTKAQFQKGRDMANENKANRLERENKELHEEINSLKIKECENEKYVAQLQTNYVNIKTDRDEIEKKLINSEIYIENLTVNNY